MKKYFKDFLSIAAALWVAQQFIKGVIISGGWSIFFLVAASLFVLNIFIRPIAKIAFLPINLVTLNLFNLVLNYVMLFALTKLIPQFQILPFYFPGYSYQGFVIPALETSQFLTLVLTGTIIGAVSTILKWFLD